MLDLPIFKETFVSPPEFIDFWSRQYSYNKEYLYDVNIGNELTEERIWNLFLWKNGRPLSQKKRISVRQNFIDEKKIEKILIPDSFLTTYLNRPGGAIWRIFWLHCNHPGKYPIYDQHVHRAMAKINGWKNLEIPYYNKKKVETYVNQYLPFWDRFLEFSPKRVDEALWVYGKFLKTGFSII